MEQGVDSEIAALIPLAGTLVLTDKQREILYAPIDEDEIEIRPDGMVYLPWTGYVLRMREAFGGGWAMIPKGLPYGVGNLVLWGFWLVIGGRPAGFAVGEQSKNSPGMTTGDQFEGAKSNARMRLCKDMGIGLELWKPAFIKRWKAKYAESYEEYNSYKQKKETKWRKRDSDAPPVNQSVAPKMSPTDLSSPQGHKFDYLSDYAKAKKAMGFAAYYQFMGQSGYEHANQIPPEKRKSILDAMRVAYNINKGVIPREEYLPKNPYIDDEGAK